MQTRVLKIAGMSCDGCVSSVTTVLEAVEGVSSVKVTLQPAEAKIEFDSDKVQVDAFRQAIEDAGFDVIDK